MRISKISTSFKGLWEIKKIGNRKDLEEGCSKEMREAIYHPFADETQSEIIEALSKESQFKRCGLFDCREPSYPKKVIETEFKVGKRLNLTADEHKNLQAMKDVGHPTGWGNYACMPLKK